MGCVGRIKFIVKVTILLAAVIGLLKLKYKSDGSAHPLKSSTFAIKQDNLDSLSNDSPGVRTRAFSFLQTSSPLNRLDQRTAEKNSKGMASLDYRDSLTATPHSKYKGTTSVGDPLIGDEREVAAEIVPKGISSVDYQDGLVLKPPSDHYQKTTPVNHRTIPSPIPSISHKNLSILYKESEDVFGLLPEHYLPEYKSFCWFDDMDEFQCLPSIYVAGMPKCGTTDLYAKLMWHPKLTPQGQGLHGGKEFHYWARRRVGRWMDLSRHARLRPPVFHFKQFLEHTGADKVKVNKSLRLVDGTPSLAWDLREWETRYPGADEPPYSNADLIHAVTPDAKILIILRQPIERLYSDYLYFWRQTSEVRNPATFHNEVLRETRRFNRCLTTKTLRNCCYSTENNLRLRLFIGIYVCYIRDWKETFGDRLMVLTLEEYHSNPIKTIIKIFNFLEVSEPNLQDLAAFITDSESIIKNDHSDVRLMVGEMRNETKEILKTFYESHNAELASLLQDSKFLFNGLF